MNKVKDQVTAFNRYARKLLEEQEVQLKSVKDDHLLSGKLARIKIFNRHLEILKEKLEQNIKSILAPDQALSADQHAKLESELKNIYADYVNEYLCISFIKDKE